MGFKVPLSLHPNSFAKPSLAMAHELLKPQERYVKFTKEGGKNEK